MLALNYRICYVPYGKKQFNCFFTTLEHFVVCFSEAKYLLLKYLSRKRCSDNTFPQMWSRQIKQ